MGRLHAALLSYLLLAIACGGGAAAPPAKPAPAAPAPSAASDAPTVAPAPQATPPTKVVACIPARQDLTLPLFAAQEGGYLRQQNVDAEMPYFAAGQVDVALTAGQCDFVFGAGGIGPLLGGLDVVVVAATVTRPPGELWARPPLSTLPDLRGRSVGTSGAGSLSWRTARYYLQVNGLTPDEDVHVAALGDSAATRGAVLSGRVDAALMFSPDTFLMKREGLNLLYKAPRSMELMNTGLVTTKRYLAANRDVVRGIVKAITEAMERLKADEAFYGTMLGQFSNNSTLDADAVHEYWQSAAELYTVPPFGSHAGAVAALELYNEQVGSQNIEALADAWLDMSLVRELYPA